MPFWLGEVCPVLTRKLASTTLSPRDGPIMFTEKGKMEEVFNVCILSWIADSSL